MKKEIVKLTISDVIRNKEIKNELTEGIATVYTTEEKINCFCLLGGVDTITALEIVVGLENLAEEIKESIAEKTSPEFLENILKKLREDLQKKEGGKQK